MIPAIYWTEQGSTTPEPWKKTLKMKVGGAVGGSFWQSFLMGYKKSLWKLCYITIAAIASSSKSRGKQPPTMAGDHMASLGTSTSLIRFSACFRAISSSLWQGARPWQHFHVRKWQHLYQMSKKPDSKALSHFLHHFGCCDFEGALALERPHKQENQASRATSQDQGTVYLSIQTPAINNRREAKSTPMTIPCSRGENPTNEQINYIVFVCFGLAAMYQFFVGCYRPISKSSQTITSSLTSNDHHHLNLWTCILKPKCQWYSLVSSSLSIGSHWQCIGNYWWLTRTK